MAEQPETPKILDEISKNTKSGSGSRKQQTARRRIFAVMVLLIPILVGLLFVGYSQMEMQQELATLRTENSQLSSVVNNQNAQLSSMQQQLEAMPQQMEVDDSATRQLTEELTEQYSQQLTQQFTDQLQSQSEEVRRLRAQLNTVASRQADDSGPSEQLWKLLEAEFLMELALRKVQIERDPLSASSLMQQADQSLADSGSPNVLLVREALTEELAALQGVEDLDEEGVYLRLQNLASQIAQVDMVGSMRENFEARRNRESVEVEASSESSGMLDSTLTFLGSIFVWRRWEDDPQAMLAPGNETAILQRLQLAVEQAKLAVLTTNNELYQGSLADCLRWLEQYAVVESELGQSVIAEVQVLQQIDVDPDFPAPVRTISLLQDLTADLR